MSDVVIHVDHLAKRYQLGVERAPYLTLRDSVARFFTMPLVSRPKPPDRAELWALDDVSFDVGRGEVVGIIGGNGAGKSTLLKILSRITTPSRGRARIVGR